MGLETGIMLLGYLLRAVPSLVGLISNTVTQPADDDDPMTAKVRAMLQAAESDLDAAIAKGKAKIGG